MLAVLNIIRIKKLRPSETLNHLKIHRQLQSIKEHPKILNKLDLKCLIPKQKLSLTAYPNKMDLRHPLILREE